MQAGKEWDLADSRAALAYSLRADWLYLPLAPPVQVRALLCTCVYLPADLGQHAECCFNSFQKPPFTLCAHASVHAWCRAGTAIVGGGSPCMHSSAQASTCTGRVHVRLSAAGRHRIRLLSEHTTMSVNVLLSNYSLGFVVPLVGFVHLSRGQHLETPQCPIAHIVRKVDQRRPGSPGEDNGHPSPRF